MLATCHPWITVLVARNIWRGMEIINLFSVRYFPVSCHFPFLIQILFSTLSYSTPSLCDSFIVRNQFPHPQRATCKIMGLWVFISISSSSSSLLIGRWPVYSSASLHLFIGRPRFLFPSGIPSRTLLTSRSSAILDMCMLHSVLLLCTHDVMFWIPHISRILSFLILWM